MNICKVCKENLVEDKYHLLITCTTYKVIHEKYYDLLDRYDDVSVIPKCPPRRVSMYMCAVSMYIGALFSHREFYYRVVTTLLRKESHTR